MCAVFCIYRLNAANDCSLLFYNKNTSDYDTYFGYVLESPPPNIRDILGCNANYVLVVQSKGAYSLKDEPYYIFESTSYEFVEKICCANLDDINSISSINIHYKTIVKGEFWKEICFSPNLNRCASIMDRVEILDVEIN